jgi:hypothetical protein
MSTLLNLLLLLTSLSLTEALTITHTAIGSAPPLPLGTPHASLIQYLHAQSLILVAASRLYERQCQQLLGFGT